jgi:antirestriction protein
MENQIFVTCLASYNSGHLHGKWIQCSSDVEEMEREAQAVIASAPVKGEEWFITDFNLHGAAIGEYTALSEIADLVALMDDHEPEVVALAYNYSGGNLKDTERLMAEYLGSYDDYEDYAAQYIENCGLTIPSCIEWHVDYKGLGEDLLCDYVVQKGDDNRLHVFGN